jgi:DNA-binding winged helix-turn-helix (wHTH) protein/TolB-like protein
MAQTVLDAYEFGPYRLEVATRRLRRGGEPVAVTPKAFDTLLVLIERRDRVVDKAELMQLIWPDSFVEEANLSQTIFMLRKTLGEDPKGRQYIDTIPRRGYRFVGDLAGASSPALSAAASAPPAFWVAATLVLAIAVGAVVWLWPRSADTGDGPIRIAVLPFENLTGETADDWLAAAFSTSLAAGLQRVDSIVTVSRERVVEVYRQRNVREARAAAAVVQRDIAAALGVRYVVHGNYQRVGDRIKVIAQLADAADGSVRAQETVTDSFENLLKVEDDLAARFAARLESRPTRVGAAPRTHSLAAHQASVEGQTLYAEDRFADAIGPLTRATTLDPSHATAWALLSKAHARMATISVISSGAVDELHRSALSEADRAVQLAPALYDAQVAVALASRGRGDLARWRTAAENAIAIHPLLAEAHALLADSYFAGNAFGCGRDRDPLRAEQHYRTALTLDPRLAAAHANFSYHYSWLTREADALTAADAGLTQLPGNRNLMRARALALIRLSRVDEAEREIRRMIDDGAAVSGQDHLIMGLIALARNDQVQAGREFQTALSRLPTSAFPLAIGRALLEVDRVDEALRHLDRAVAVEPSCSVFIATSPAFAPHRNRTEFASRLAEWRTKKKPE